MSNTRVCRNCGASLAGMRSNARHCGGACRADASRKRRAALSISNSGGDDSAQALIGKRTEAHEELLGSLPESVSAIQLQGEVEYEPATILGPRIQEAESRDEWGGATHAPPLPAIALTVVASEETLRVLATYIARVVVADLRLQTHDEPTRRDRA